jgi:hypothetical protein
VHFCTIFGPKWVVWGILNRQKYSGAALADTLQVTAGFLKPILPFNLAITFFGSRSAVFTKNG